MLSSLILCYIMLAGSSITDYESVIKFNHSLANFQLKYHQKQCFTITTLIQAAIILILLTHPVH